MLYLRRADDRGSVNLGWLHSQHSFSFGSYYDPEHMGFSTLRVINDDKVKPGAGFDTHSHRDMEIISYVLEGELAHKDSLGNEFIVPEGEVQRMSAGTGVTHSEYNASQERPVKFLQIWIEPEKKGIEPGYEQATISQTGSVTTIVSPDGRDNSLSINQNAYLHRLELSPDENITLPVSNRDSYVHMISGQGEFFEDENTLTLNAGDAVGIRDHSETVHIHAGPDGLVALWFEL